MTLDLDATRFHEPLDEHLHAAIADAVHPHHHRNAPDDRQVVRLGLFDARVLLGQQEDKAAVTEALFDRSDAFGSAHPDGCDHEGKDDQVAQRENGQLSGDLNGSVFRHAHGPTGGVHRLALRKVSEKPGAGLIDGVVGGYLKRVDRAL